MRSWAHARGPGARAGRPTRPAWGEARHRCVIAHYSFDRLVGEVELLYGELEA
jgi:hypothetical protein